MLMLHWSTLKLYIFANFGCLVIFSMLLQAKKYQNFEASRRQNGRQKPMNTNMIKYPVNLETKPKKDYNRESDRLSTAQVFEFYVRVRKWLKGLIYTIKIFFRSQYRESRNLQLCYSCQFNHKGPRTLFHCE